MSIDVKNRGEIYMYVILDDFHKHGGQEKISRKISSEK